MNVASGCANDPGTTKTGHDDGGGVALAYSLTYLISSAALSRMDSIHNVGAEPFEDHFICQAAAECPATPCAFPVYRLSNHGFLHDINFLF